MKVAGEIWGPELTEAREIELWGEDGQTVGLEILLEDGQTVDAEGLLEMAKELQRRKPWIDFFGEPVRARRGQAFRLCRSPLPSPMR